MATINATPNPVGVYSATVGSATYVTWDTAPTPIAAKLLVSTNGGAPVEVGGQPASGEIARTQPLRVPVTIPNTYRLVLRSVPPDPDDPPTDLASLVVDTFDIRQELAESFSASYRPPVRPQAIKNLSISPGIDVVLVTFRTTRPTIPLIELRDASGVKIDARWALLGGLQTEHQAFFGEDPALALESKHSIRIVVPGSGGKDIEVTADFITGSRKAEVIFDEVDIFDDSDPGLRGEGEFMFNFGAGDVVTKESFGPNFLDLGWIGLDPNDDHVPLGRSISIPKAPRLLWVQTIVFESDSSAWPPEWFESFRSQVDFALPGTSFESAEDHQEVTVTAFVDIDNDVGSTVTAFELNPGNFSIAFVMKGHIVVDSAFGQVLKTKSAPKRPRPKAVAPLSEAGMSAFVAPAWGVEDAQVFAYGPDNSLYYRVAAKPRLKPGADGWTRVELPVSGRATIAASAPGTFDLFLHRDDGGVMHSRKAGKGKPGAWRSLGGDFDDLLVTAGSAKGKGADVEVTLFGLGKDGTLAVRVAGGGEWQRLDDQPATAIALAELEGGDQLFSAGGDRRLRYHLKRSGKWRAEAFDQPIPGRERLRAIAISLIGKPDKDRGPDLVIGALSEDHRARLLHWPDFPRGKPASGWEDAGTLQDLFTGSSRRAKPKPIAKAPAERATKPPAKGGARKRGG